MDEAIAWQVSEVTRRVWKKEALPSTAEVITYAKQSGSDFQSTQHITRRLPLPLTPIVLTQSPYPQEQSSPSQLLHPRRLHHPAVLDLPHPPLSSATRTVDTLADSRKRKHSASDEGPHKNQKIMPVSRPPFGALFGTRVTVGGAVYL